MFPSGQGKTPVLQYNAGNSKSYLDSNNCWENYIYESLELILKLVLEDAGKESKQTEEEKYISVWVWWTELGR